MRFSIYRFNPETDEKPRMQDFDIEINDNKAMINGEPHNAVMLLDVLLLIKNQIDETLTLRRSCREGVCGSDGMNVNGKNRLACTTRLTSLSDPIVIRPLPGLPVVRDLVVDMTQFYNQYNKAKPYLQNNEPAPATERLQSPDARGSGG